MQEKLQINLRILSGPNLGASIELGAGQYVVGTGDSCDIILADNTLANRHLLLTIKELDSLAKFQVQISPLDAPVFIDRKKVLAEGVSLEAGAICSMGFTAFAWQKDNLNWDSVDLVCVPTGSNIADLQAQELAQLENDKKNEINSLDDAASNESNNAEAEETKDSSAPSLAVLANDKLKINKAEGKRKRSVTFWIASSIIMILLSGFIFAFEPKQKMYSELINNLNIQLNEANLKDVVAVQGQYGIAIKGFVNTDAELNFLSDLIRKFEQAVYIEVAVKNDLIKAVNAALTSHGLYPNIRSVDNASDTISIEGYLKDGLTEAWALNIIATDVPTAKNIQRKIVFAEVVEKVLNDELAKVELPEIQINYLAGQIIIYAQLDVNAEEQLKKVITQTQQRLQTPILFTITKAQKIVEAPSLVKTLEDKKSLQVQDKLTQPMGQTASITSSNITKNIAALGGLKIIGVTTSPMKFLSMSDGQQLFEGTTLPNGYTISKITKAEVFLTKDNNTITQQLGANNE